MEDNFERDYPIQYYDMGARILENSWRFDEELNSECSKIERASQAAFVQRCLIEQAENQCKLEGHQPDTDESWAIYEQAADIASQLTWPKYLAAGIAFNEDQSRVDTKVAKRAFRLTNSSYPDQLVLDAREGKALEIDKDEFEFAVGQYLSGKLRDERVDRLILFTLLDVEITHFLKTIYFRNILAEESQYDEYQRIKSPVMNWFYLRLRRGIYAVSLSVASVSVSIIFDGIESTFAVGIVLVLFCLWALDALTALLRLPALLARLRDNQSKLEQIFDVIPTEMQKIYVERWSDGPISIARLRNLVERSGDLGISWPSSIWPMLEDLEARGIKVF